MKITDISLKNLAIYVSDHLRKNEIENVLSGGACVAIYTENRYLSYDLDFVLLDYVKQKKITAALETIGFRQKGNYYCHPDTQFFIECLPPPLSVGQEPVKVVSEIEKDNLLLKLLSPTDCVKDRLAAYYHWNDLPSLEQALMVSKDNEVDLREIERWSINEEMKNKFEIFKRNFPSRRG